MPHRHSVWNLLSQSHMAWAVNKRHRIFKWHYTISAFLLEIGWAKLGSLHQTGLTLIILFMLSMPVAISLVHFTPLKSRTQNPWSLCEIGQILVGLPHPARIRAWWLNSSWSCWGKRLATYLMLRFCNKSTTLLCQDAQSPYDSIVPGHQYRRSVAAVQHQIVGDHQSSTEWTSWRPLQRSGLESEALS